MDLSVLEKRVSEIEKRIPRTFARNWFSKKE